MFGFMILYLINILVVLFIVFCLHHMCALTYFNPEAVSAFILLFFLLENVPFQYHIDLLYSQDAVKI